MHTRFRPDHGLTTRMVVTLFLLALVYAAFIAALLVLIDSVIVVVTIAGALLFVQYWFSDRVALYAMRARIVTPEQEPRLPGIIDRLCATADMPKPQVAIADMELPNAFATGRSTQRAVLCVTTGLRQRLDTEELEGVLAHELSHVAHRDVVIMTIASFLGVLAGLIARFAFYSSMFGGGGRRDSRDNTFMVILAVMAVSVAVYAISFLLVRALSRYRELAADRAGAMLTGRPSALASALTKVSGQITRIPTRDLRTVEAFNAFFFTPAISSGFSLSSLFSTHPTLERRLDQLADLSTQLGEVS